MFKMIIAISNVKQIISSIINTPFYEVSETTAAPLTTPSLYHRIAKMQYLN